MGGEFLPSNFLMDMLAVFACSDGSLLQGICENVVFLMTGYDQTQMNETMLETIANHIPAGTSSYVVLQYAQGVNNKEFMGMNWGDDELNIQHHGTVEPPKYDLSRINTNVENYEVPWPEWNHLDFLYAIDIEEYQNNHL